MPAFTYTARALNGDLRTATIDAPNRDDVITQLRKQRLTSDMEFPADRAAISEKLLGMSNADLEAILLLAAENASGPEAKPVDRVTKGEIIQAMGDYLPSRDVKMLEYMELLAVFEAVCTYYRVLVRREAVNRPAH